MTLISMVQKRKSPYYLKTTRAEQMRLSDVSYFGASRADNNGKSCRAVFVASKFANSKNSTGIVGQDSSPFQLNSIQAFRRRQRIILLAWQKSELR